MKRKIYSTLFVLLFAIAAYAQDNEQPIDTLTRHVAGMRQELDILKRIKFSGYVQAQFQWADSAGISSYAGGDFPAHVDKRFKVRRAEFKTTYDNGITQIVANIDVTQNGINIKDAYGKFTEQKFKVFSLTAGIFNRPFGFEVPFSSGMLESPERTRMIQTLFPGERDLGAMITYRPTDSSPFHPLKIEAGFFNGTGNNFNDFDSQKDFIGNIHWSKTNKTEKISYALGASFYDGGWSNGTATVYSDVSTLANGNKGFQTNTSPSNLYAINKRQYTGADFQFSVDWFLGITTLRGEYIQGSQPGTSSSSVSPGSQPVDKPITTIDTTTMIISTSIPNSDTYQRNFNGGYFTFLQNLGKSKHQLEVKYDWYDANSDVSGDDIGKAGTKLSKTDLKYTTLALAWIYHMDTNIKFTLYYDMVTNDTSKNLSFYTQDLKDNVVTLRVQFKF